MSCSIWDSYRRFGGNSIQRWRYQVLPKRW